mmetsp:Transcript_25173/g.56826  ORF Transcript_25173/g.56826 Transcript_25173/m.56826 type:complete len:217 (+) Transcript_25173:1523-2173(+)
MMLLEKERFRFQRFSHRLRRINVPLASIHHPDVPVLEGVHLPLQHVSRICPLVHQVQLRQHPDRPAPVRVHHPRHLQPVRVGDVLVGGRHGEDDAVRLLDELSHHGADHLRDVVRLVPNRDLSQAREVNQRQVKHALAVHAQDDGLLRHGLVGSSDLVRLDLDCPAHLVEACELLIDVRKLCIVLRDLLMQELQYEGSSCADTASSRKEVIAHETF